MVRQRQEVVLQCGGGVAVEARGAVDAASQQVRGLVVLVGGLEEVGEFVEEVGGARGRGGERGHEGDEAGLVGD